MRNHDVGPNQYRVIKKQFTQSSDLVTTIGQVTS